MRIIINNVDDIATAIRALQVAEDIRQRGLAGEEGDGYVWRGGGRKSEGDYFVVTVDDEIEEMIVTRSDRVVAPPIGVMN